MRSLPIILVILHFIQVGGFIIGSALAYELNASLVLVRKKGKLPFDTLVEDYEVLAVSIDPRDTPARADSAKARFANLAAFGDLDAFHFWTVGEEHEASVQALADAGVELPEQPS